MSIVDSTKFIIGIAFAIIGLAVLVSGRGSRGFGQRQQAGALFLIGAAIFIAIGFGLIGHSS